MSCMSALAARAAVLAATGIREENARLRRALFQRGARGHVSRSHVDSDSDPDTTTQTIDDKSSDTAFRHRVLVDELHSTRSSLRDAKYQLAQLRRDSVQQRMNVIAESNRLQSIARNAAVTGGSSLSELRALLVSSGCQSSAQLQLLDGARAALSRLYDATCHYSDQRSRRFRVDKHEPEESESKDGGCAELSTSRAGDASAPEGSAGTPRSKEAEFAPDPRASAIQHLRAALVASEAQSESLQQELIGTRSQLRRAEKAAARAQEAAGHIVHYQAAVQRMEQLCRAAEARVRTAQIDKESAEDRVSALAREVASLRSQIGARRELEELAHGRMYASASMQPNADACLGPSARQDEQDGSASAGSQQDQAGGSLCASTVDRAQASQALQTSYGSSPRGDTQRNRAEALEPYAAAATASAADHQRSVLDQPASCSMQQSDGPVQMSQSAGTSTHTPQLGIAASIDKYGSSAPKTTGEVATAKDSRTSLRDSRGRAPSGEGGGAASKLPLHGHGQQSRDSARGKLSPSPSSDQSSRTPSVKSYDVTMQSRGAAQAQRPREDSQQEQAGHQLEGARASPCTEAPHQCDPNATHAGGATQAPCVQRSARDVAKAATNPQQIATAEHSVRQPGTKQVYATRQTQPNQPQGGQAELPQGQAEHQPLLNMRGSPDIAATSEAAAPPSDPPPRASKPSRPVRSRGSSQGSSASVASQPVNLQPSHTGASGATSSDRQKQYGSPVNQRSAGSSTSSSKGSSRLGTAATPSASSLGEPGSQSQARRSRHGAMLDFTAGESVIVLAMPQDETWQSSAGGDSRSGSHASACDDPGRTTVSDSRSRPSPPTGAVEEQQHRLVRVAEGDSAGSGHLLRVPPMVQVVSSEGSGDGSSNGSTTAPHSTHESPTSSGVNSGPAARSFGRNRAEATEHQHGSGHHDGPAPPMPPTSARTDDSGGRWAPPVPLASRGLPIGALKGVQSSPVLARGAGGEMGGPSPLIHGILRQHGSMNTNALAREMIAEDYSSRSSDADAQGSQREADSRADSRPGGSVASASSRHILATVDALLEEISSDSSN